MKYITHTRTAALLVVLALTASACAAASADNGAENPTTTAPTTTVPTDTTVPSDDPGAINWRPIEAEGDLPTEGDVVGGGEIVAVDGNRLTIGFWMGVDDCFGVERIDVVETETKVGVDITVAARDADQVCIALAEARSVTVELDAPVGGRIVEIGGVTVNG